MAQEKDTEFYIPASNLSLHSQKILREPELRPRLLEKGEKNKKKDKMTHCSQFPPEPAIISNQWCLLESI